MKMVIVFVVISIAVLLPEVLGADIQCFAVKEVELSEKMQSVESVNDFCREMKVMTNEILNISRSCGFLKTDLSKLDAFIGEFCNTDSDLYNKFKQSKECLLQNENNVMECTSLLIINSSKPKEEDLGEIFQLLCKNNVFDNVFECINNKLGEPCGNDGLQVVGRFTNAYSSYINSVCDEINGSSSLTSLSWSILVALLAIYVMWK